MEVLIVVAACFGTVALVLSALGWVHGRETQRRVELLEQDEGQRGVPQPVRDLSGIISLAAGGWVLIPIGTGALIGADALEADSRWAVPLLVTGVLAVLFAFLCAFLTFNPRWRHRQRQGGCPGFQGRGLP